MLIHVIFMKKLDEDASLRELLMTGIRMMKGVEKSRFSKALSEKQSELQKLIDDGYLKESNDRLCLTEKGMLFFDDVACDLI